MKKFKLFALAVFAMLSTNVFAAGESDANTVFRFNIITDYVAATNTLGTAEITGFVADYTAVATTTIPATINGASLGGKYKVVSIADNAFKGKAIKKIDLSAAENLEYIGFGALAGTGITSLDLSKTKVSYLAQLFEATNTKVTEVKLPKTLTFIGVNAFKGLSALTTITFAEQTAPATYHLTIESGAFENTMALTKLTLPANIDRIAAGAFVKTKLTELTISGTIPEAVADVPATYTATADDPLVDGKWYYEDAAGANPTLGDGATPGAGYFEETAPFTPGAGVQAGAFDRNGSQKLKITYTPGKVGGVYVNPFVTAAGKSECFGGAAAAKWVTLATSADFGAKIEGWIANFYGVDVKYTAVADGSIEVFNKGSKFSYGTWYDAANSIVIEKKQGEDKKVDVMVYGAYVDHAEENAILMDQLMLIEGTYIIPAGTPVVVKSSSDAKVEYNKLPLWAPGDPSSVKVDYNGDDVNDIEVYAGADCYASDVVPAAGYDFVIFLLPLDKTAFGWSEFSDTRVVKEGQFYLSAINPAAARRVIWLDGSEEDQVTAIKTVKSAKAENGAIFNLAGQKVNAAYKGVVIKDGKKYIQK